jgi:hypothetical protein
MQNSCTLKELSVALNELDSQVLTLLQAFQDKYNVEISEVRIFKAEEMGKVTPYIYQVAIGVSVF